MKTILFYTANGIGLGHLRRTQLIADELKKKGVKIILATSSLFPQKLGRFFSHLVKLNPLTGELINCEKKYLSNREENKQKLNKAINKFKPDVIASDIYLSDYSFYPLEGIFGRFLGKKIYVWRLSFNKPVLELRKNSYKLSHFDKIIIPHAKDEISFFSPHFLKMIENNSRFEIVGPIVKTSDKSAAPFLEKKYQISKKDFVLTLALGAGGGNLKTCQPPDRIVKVFLEAYPQLIKSTPNLKVILSTGPYFKKMKKFSGINIIRFEKNLSELFGLSNLVISAAGYNTCNELIQTKAPSILIPLKRGNDEQFKRAEYLKSKGICQTIEKISKENILKTISQFKKPKVFPKLISGNKKAAKIILDLL